MTTLFLHGLESSGKGTKGTFLHQHYPHVLCPDFSGSLQERLDQLESICTELNELTLIGSSFGGLMATCFAITHPENVKQLVLLAPALNFEGYRPPDRRLTVPTLLVIGEEDIVCPPDLVLPLAEQTFAELEVILEDDDHMLHDSFRKLDWDALIPAD